MNDKLVGIILESSPYRENDLLLKVMTRDEGIISLSARGSQKMTAKCHFMPFCIYEFIVDLKENKTIYTPRNVQLITNYMDDTDIKKLAFFNCLISIIKDNSEFVDEDYYDNFLFVLDNYSTKDMYLLGALFVSQVLKKTGITPMVDGCVICSNQSVVGLSYEKGGFLCRNHVNESDILDVIRLKKFRMVNKAQMENYDILKDFDYDARDFDLMISFYMENAEVKLKSYDFFRQL